MQIKINQKTYELSGNWNFNEFVKLEEIVAVNTESSLIQLIQKPQFFIGAVLVTCLATGKSYEDSIELVNQHCEGGGDFTKLSEMFYNGIQSDFFQKHVLKQEETKDQDKKAKGN